MKFLRSLPSDRETFSYYAPLMPSVRTAGWFAQLISYATEVSVLTALLTGSIKDWLPPERAYQVAIIAALILALFLELSLRKLLPYSIRSFFYWKFKGSDLPITIPILLSTVLLLMASGYLSFTGSPDVVEQFAPEVEQLTTTAADSLATADRDQVRAEWVADSIAIANRYAPQITAIEAVSTAKVGQLNARIRSYTSRETADTKYTSAKVRIREQIETAKAEAAAQIAALQGEQAKELAATQAARKTAVQAIAAAQSAKRDSIAQLNLTATTKAREKVESYGGSLAWFTVFALVILIASILIEEAYKKATGQTVTAAIEDYDFRPSVFTELRSAFRNRANQVARNAIMRFDNKTKDAPLPNAIRPVIDVTELAQPFGRVDQAKPDDLQIQIPIRRPIGFHRSDADRIDGDRQESSTHGDRNTVNVDGDRQTKDSEEGRKRDCKHCGTPFTYKHWNKQYCSDACREAAWEARTGRKIKKGKKDKK